VFDDVTAGGEVGRHDDVGPVVCPLHGRGMQRGPAPSRAARIGAGERRRQGPAPRGAVRLEPTKVEEDLLSLWAARTSLQASTTWKRRAQNKKNRETFGADGIDRIWGAYLFHIFTYNLEGSI
jgi:hypothetical protein